jgi:hypothetical protein
MLQNVPDPRGKQGQDYFLWSILGLIVVSLLCGRRGMLAAFHLRRSLNKRQRLALGFTKGVTPCHATLTETLRAIDGRALAQALGAAYFAEGEDQRHIAIDSKTMRASKDGNGHATHVLSAFCAGLQSILGNEASRGKGMEIPDALKLLDQLDLKDKIVTGDAIFCQKSIVATITEKGGGYVFPVKDNQKNLRENIATAFNEPVFSPSSRLRALSKRRMGASNGIRLTCFQRTPPASRTFGREHETHLPRHALSARQEERPMERAREGSRLSDRPFSEWRGLARSALVRQSRPLGHRDHASKQGRHPRRGRLHKSKRRSAAKHLFPYWLRAQNIEIRLALSNPSSRTVPGRQEQGLALVRRVIPDFTESPWLPMIWGRRR